jgi:signal transduction histidine kinase
MDTVMELILNVDDYAPGRYARTKVLQQAGFSVWEAATGKEALNLVAEYLPPLVLLDVNLPDMSGFEVCKQIRMDARTAATTILHISASNVLAHHQVQGLNCGADSYLVEPVDPTVLIATIKAFLRARHAEDALRRSNEELEWFGYRVAHDLSEPLRTVIAHTQLLDLELGPRLDKQLAESLHFVGEAAERMRLFIDGLLRYAQDAHAGVTAANLDCETMFVQITQNLEAAIRASNARITHDHLPPVVADKSIEYVFQNLISNAIKYRRPGASLEIHVSAAWSGGAWEFSVRDNGLGIDPRHKHGIFQIFQRLHGHDVPGTGIGLALSKKIVEAHSGRIWVESEPGVGSTFYFTLPQETPEIPPTVERAKTA